MDAAARRAGVLAHPTSMPGPFGIGDLGPATVRFLDWMAEAGLTVWQMLPLGPPGPGNSPYSCRSAFAGNPLLISPRLLEPDHGLSRHPGGSPPALAGRVDFEVVGRWKLGLLRESWSRFKRHAPPRLRGELEAFVEDPAQAEWLEDWALFGALHARFDGRPWPSWEPELRDRRPAALGAAARELADAIGFQRYVQFLFFRQWEALRRESASRGILLMGDLPYYVALDSADVWTHRDLFDLDEAGRPRRVAGVPPDYFSATGQLWGNPLYDWRRLARERFGWWVSRVRANLRQVDLLRLDHFRGFVAFWSVEAGSKTAARGGWTPGPGRALFDRLAGALGGLPFVAEDLGVITDDVDRLREELGLPGMHVLQFGITDPGSRHHPSRHRTDGVVYTGTHDNDTTRGWFEALGPVEQRSVLEAVGAARRQDVVRRMIDTAYRSAAGLAVVPFQDLLDLGSSARMNTPSRTQGNWEWRAGPDALTLRLASLLRKTGALNRRVV